MVDNSSAVSSGLCAKSAPITVSSHGSLISDLNKNPSQALKHINFASAVGAWRAAVISCLKAVSCTAALDFDVLLMHVLHCARASLYAHPERILSIEQQAQFKVLLGRVLQSEPVAYVLGVREFYGYTLKVTKDTLIPRPETELLIDWILQQVVDKPGLKVIDLGTGSGAIACALAELRPHWALAATDISSAALKVAKHNAQNLGCIIDFYQGSWLRAVPATKKFDIIIANPPYVANTEECYAGAHHEPAMALYATENGYADLLQIIAQAADHLFDQGYLLLEHGATQQQRVMEALRQAGFSVLHAAVDTVGLPRFVAAKKHD